MLSGELGDAQRRWCELTRTRYYPLVSSKEWSGNADVKALCSSILAKTIQDEDKYQIGLTKIFFRAGMLAYLESLRSQRLNELVTLVQKNVRRYLAYKEYRNMRQKAIKIQTWWRGILAVKYTQELRRQTAATRIQRVARGYLARKKYLAVRQAVVKIQSGELTRQWNTPMKAHTALAIRGHQARVRALEERKNTAILNLQSLFRGL